MADYIWNALSYFSTNRAKQANLGCDDSWIKLQYYYVGGVTGVPGAGYVILDLTSGGVLASGVLNAGGYVFELVPKGSNCEYYFHDDPPYLIDGAFKCPARTLTPLGDRAVQEAINNELLKDVKSLWGETKFIDQGDFETSPTLGKIAASAAIRQTAYVPHAKTEEEFASLLFALLIQESDELWAAVAFNRLGCVSDRGRLIAAIVYSIYCTPDIDLPSLMDMLNTAGKGNAVRWLRVLGGDMDGHIAAVTDQIDKILTETKSECDKISGAGKKKKVSTEIRALAGVVSERIGLLQPKVAAAIKRILDTPAATLKVTAAGHVLKKRAGTLEDTNIFTQTAIALVEWAMPVLPPVRWIALQYSYTDQTGVDGARYVVAGDKGNWNGPLNAAGFAFIPMVPDGTVFTFFFEGDPPFVLDANFKSKNNTTAELPADFLTRAINADRFKNAALKWTDVPCSDIGDFQARPTPGKILHNLLIRHSTVVAAKGEEQPLVKVLYAQILKPQEELWMPCALHRLSAVLADEGLLVQAVLCQIHADPGTTREKLINILNTAGKGNAVVWLKDLHSKMGAHATAVCQNLTRILADFKTELQRVQNAQVAKVGDAARAGAGALVDRVDDLTAVVDNKIKAAMTVLADRLRDIVAQPHRPPQPGVLDQVNRYTQTAEPLPQWQAPVVVLPAWIALQCLHADGAGVGNAKYVIEFDDGTASKTGDLNGAGFAFVPDMPLGKSFQYYFHTDPNPDLTLADAKKSTARASAPIDGDFVQGAIDSDKFKTVTLRWGKTEIVNEQDFQDSPTVGKIARNLVIRDTEFTTRLNDERELTDLLYPLLLRQGDNSAFWSAAVFSRLGCVLKEESALTQGILLQMKQDPNTKLDALVTLVNSAAKGNAVKWLRKLNGNMADCKGKVAASLTKILGDLKTECAKLKDGDPLHVSASARSYAQMVWDRIDVVRPLVNDEVGKVLDPIAVSLNTAVGEHLLPKQPGALETVNFFKQTSAAPPVWQPDPAEQLPWAELLYFHADGSGVGLAGYRLETGVGALVREGFLDANGFAFVPDLPDATFKFFFRDDPAAYTVGDGHKTVARAIVPLGADFVDLAIAGDKLKAAVPGFFSWDSRAISDQPAFEGAPTIGKIAHQAVLLKTLHVAQKDDEDALAKLIAPLIKKTVGAAPLWTGAVFNRLGALEVPEARVIQELLCYLKDNGAVTAAGLVKCLNDAGKGNAVRWLKKLRDDMPTHIAAVIQNLKDIFAEFQSQCGKIVAADKDKFGAGIQSYAKALSDGVGALDIDTQVKGVLDPLVTALKDKLTGFTIDKPLGTLCTTNELRQEAVPLAAYQAPAGILKPWIYIQYLHADLTPVASEHVLAETGGGNVSTGVLDAAGGKFVDELDGGKTYEFYFRKEAAFAIDAPRKSVASTLVALTPNLVTMDNKYWNDTYHLTQLKKTPFGWGDTGIASMAEFEGDPNIGKISRNVVRKHTNTAFLTKAGDCKDELEMTEMVRYLVMDNADANRRVWSIVAMNRIGTQDADGLLRRSVLLRLQFENPGGATTLVDLVSMLNSTGKGHAVEWLQKLAADLPLLIRDVAIANAETILEEIKVELNKLKNRVGGVGIAGNVPISGHVKTIADARAVQAGVAKAAASANIKAVIDPLTLKLKNLLPPTAPQLRFKQTGSLNQVNVFVQPKMPFPECTPDCYIPPAWPLDPNVEVVYRYADPPRQDPPVAIVPAWVINNPYHIETEAGGALVNGNTDAAGSSTVKVLPAGTTGVKYWFADDPLAYAVKAEIKPWPNPYRPLTVVAAGYATAAAATGNLSAIPRLPEGSLTIRDQVAFNAAPSLNAMIADAVVRSTVLVSAAGDVQDMAVVILNLIADTPVMTPAIWFRAGVNRIGTIANVGSVLRGLFLFFRYKAPVSGETLLALMNWAGRGNVTRWLKAENANMAGHMNTAVASVYAILDELKARVEELRVHNQVNQGIKLQMASLKVRIKVARDAADAEIKAALGTDLPALTGLLAAGALHFKFYASPLTRNVYQQKVEPFLECNDTIGSACKQAADEEAAARIIAGNDPAFLFNLGDPAPVPGTPQANLFNAGSTDQHAWRALSEFGSGARGAEAKRLAPILAQASKATFAATVEGEVGATLASVRALGAAPQVSVVGAWTITFGSWSGGEMWSFEHTDGSLIRYKPDGDDFMKPPCATYSIELLKNPNPVGLGGYVAAGGNPLAHAAFKIDAQGNAVPKGPPDIQGLTVLPGPCLGGNLVEVNKHYKDHVMKSGHRPMRF